MASQQSSLGQPSGQPSGQPVGQATDRFQGFSDEDLQAEIQKRQQAKQAQQPQQAAGGATQQPQPQRAKKPANPAARKPRTNKPVDEMTPFNMQEQMGAIGNTFNKFLKTSNQ